LRAPDGLTLEVFMQKFSLLPDTVKVSTPAQAVEVVLHLSTKRLLAVDTETTGLSRTRDRAIILSLSSGPDRYCVFPEALPYFKDLLENPEIKLICHNANFDSWMLLNAGIDLNRRSGRAHYRVYDTMVMHALLDSDMPHDLKFLSKRYLGINMVPFRDVFGAKLRKLPLEQILLDPANEDIVVNYAGLDAYATYHLFVHLREQLLHANTDNAQYPTLWSYYMLTELPYTKILWSMEREGIRMDDNELRRQAPILEREILDIQKWFGRELRKLYINLRSNDQMGDLFFGGLGYQPVSYTDEGSPQLNKAALKVWAGKGCQFATKLLEYRDLDKKFSTYTVGLLKMIHGDNRIHCSFNQTGARTGRLSSSSPNLQNQPPYVRSAYVAAPRQRLMARDYEQLEMRILAHMSGDPTLCNAIKNGLDVHSSTAATMFKVDYADIMAAREKDDRISEAKKAAKMLGLPQPTDVLTPHEKVLVGYRKIAKTINFGLMYGQGANKLASTVGVTKDEALKLIDTYFRTFPLVSRYFNRAINRARETGYCVTILGRRRPVLNLRSHIYKEVAEAERKVKNTPIQGTAAEIVKMAMIKIWEDPLIAASGVRMLLQVHDELVFEGPEDAIMDEEIDRRISNYMSHPFDTFDLIVPLETAKKTGSNWYECK
jgi:DNA polymerase I